MKNTNLALLVILVSSLGIGCKGTKGDPGASGAPGAPGGGRVVSTINCQGTVNKPSIPEINGIEVGYSAVLTAGGDVYATADVIDASTQASSTQFYAAAEAGSTTGQVVITNDYVGTANGGYWKISLNRTTLVTSVVYDDLSLPGAVNMAFTPSSCTVRNF